MVKVVWLFIFHVISAQLQQSRDTFCAGCCFALLKSVGLSRPFALALPLAFCLAEKPVCVITFVFSLHIAVALPQLELP